MTQTLLLSPRSRQIVAQAIARAPDGWAVTLGPPPRSSEQNARLWAMLGQFAKLWPEHAGVRMDAEAWKAVFMHACGMPQAMVASLDGRGFVATGYRSSKLNRAQFGDLMTAIEAEAARRGVIDIFTGETVANQEAEQ